VNNQFLEVFEIIFIDANSTDGSLQTIENYNFRAGIEKTIIKCEDRITIYEAWNKGLEVAKYDWVMNYNTDDKIFPGSLLTLSTYTKLLLDVDVFYSNCWISNSENHSRLVGHFNWNNANDLAMLLNFGSCCGPFPLLKKKSIIEMGGFDTKYTFSSDYDMWCKLSSKGYKFVKIDDVVGSYYHNPKGVSTNPGNHQERVIEDTKIRQFYG
jgi:glycosyltransferase involved in cell wall biosynthesis